eukprot:6341245-Amphidinium_carterae.1
MSLRRYALSTPNVQTQLYARPIVFNEKLRTRVSFCWYGDRMCAEFLVALQWFLFVQSAGKRRPDAYTQCANLVLATQTCSSGERCSRLL